MKIEFDQQCSSCKGTGLYVGMAERDGFAVVCHNCKGTGQVHYVHEFEEFTGRKDRENVSRVVQANPGIILGGIYDFGGISYSEWKKTGQFPAKSEMRNYICPSWWYQSVDYSKKPDWKECWGCGSFSGCKHFTQKEKCWERWDKENN